MLALLSVLLCALLQPPAASAVGIENASQKSAPAKKAAPKRVQKKAPAAPKAPPDPWQLPMRVVIAQGAGKWCEPHCPQWISAQGKITDATPALFRSVLRKAGQRKLPVILSSPGGSIPAAVQIGRMIRKAGLDVAVGFTDFWDCRPEDKSCVLPKELGGVYPANARLSYGVCASACPLILAGGVTRYASFNAMIGVHQLRTTWAKEQRRYLETYRIVNGKKKVISRKLISRKITSYDTFGITKSQRKMLDAYLDEMGVSHDLIDEMAEAVYSSLHSLPSPRLKALGLINSLVEPASFLSACVADPTAAGCRGPVRPTPAASPETAMVVSLQRGIACEPSCPEWISAEGVVTPDAVRQFREIFAATVGTRLPVVLDSPGGDLDAALEIGGMIRDRQLTTMIATSAPVGCGPREAACNQGRDAGLPYRAVLVLSGECQRECLFMLAGGVERLVGLAGETTYLPPLGEFRTQQRGRQPADLIAAFLDRIGVSRHLFEALRKSGPAGGLFLGPQDLIREGLGTDSGVPGWVGKPALCGQPGASGNCVRRG